jgi:hypothetical protein
MPRTSLRTQNTFNVSNQGNVTFPSASSPSSGTVLIAFPAGSKAGTGLHWHETHTEYLQVVQGVALITLGDITEKFKAKDGIITIPRYVVHGYRRAEGLGIPGDDGRDVDLIIKEWTDPDDGQKEVFFRNILGIILDSDPNAGMLGNIWMLWSLFVVFNELDNYPALLRLPKVLGPLGRDLERRFTHAV